MASELLESGAPVEPGTNFPIPTSTAKTDRLPSRQTVLGLDLLNFFLADVQSGVGPFIAIYLAGFHWDEQQAGLALTVAGIAGIIAQTPAGQLVDNLRAKRSLIAVGIVALALGALLIAWFPSFWPVLTAQALIGATSSLFGPALCAISLGLVGRRFFDRRQARNLTFGSAGNVVAALAMGAIGYWFSNRGIFYFVVACTIPTLLALGMIRPGEIDHAVARGANAGDESQPRLRVFDLLEDRVLAIFLCCAVLFHFANAAMLPLLGEMLARGHAKTSMAFMSACVITTQVVVTLLAGWCGRQAGLRGRKPLLLLAFAVLPIRGLLYTLTTSPTLLVGIQILDGIAAAIFGVVSVLVIADLTRGTGRFNLTLGAISTAVGIGAALSQWIAGGVVHHLGFHAGFLFLGAIAMVALVVLHLYMPETLRRED